MLLSNERSKGISTPQDLGDQVFGILENAIVSGKLKPGDKMLSIEIANELGVSATPVREAIKQLEKEGLVCRTYHKTPTVKGMTVEDVYEIFSLREVLEGLAARLATANATDKDIKRLENTQAEGEKYLSGADWISYENRSNMQFHVIMLEIARNVRLTDMLTKLHTHNNFLITTRLRIAGTPQKSIDEHRAVISAIKQRDGDAAERLMRAHIARAMRNTIDLIKSRK